MLDCLNLRLSRLNAHVSHTNINFYVTGKNTHILYMSSNTEYCKYVFLIEQIPTGYHI